MPMEEQDLWCSRDALEETFWAVADGEDSELAQDDEEGAEFYESDVEDDGDYLWDAVAASSDREEDSFDYLDIPTASPPPWSVRFTPAFRQALRKLDRKLQGRALEAIVEVTGLHFPFRYLGDTFKPLHGDLDGLWRYRVGDWRLVIKPKVGAAEIELVTFAARGSVYD